MASGDSPKKPKSYYVDYTNKKFGRTGKNSGRFGGAPSRFKSTPDISSGNRGFLITAIDEVKCYLEMRQIFEEYFDILYKSNDDKVDKQNQDNSGAIEDELESELKQLRKNRPFKQLKTQCRNSLFINIVDNFSYIDPIAVVDRFFSDLEAQAAPRTSNTFKVLPVVDTFKTNNAAAQESISNQLNTRFKDDLEPKKYFIEFQSRGNYKLDPDDKMKMVEAVAETIANLRPNWAVSRESADYMVILVAFKNVCCLSIVTEYFKRRKYNLVEFTKGPNPDDSDQSQDKYHDCQQQVDESKSIDQCEKE